MNINVNLQNKRTTTLAKVCIGFTLLTILVIFFEADLGRLLTPFIEPFLLLLLALVYLILVITSIIYIPFHFKKASWHSFLPLLINVISLLSIYYLYLPLTYLRVNTDFLLKKNRFDQVTQWINASIQSDSLSLEDGTEETVVLPKEYNNLADRNRVYVTQENGNIRIFFSRGGGMFEYYPGYMYHSGNISPPIEDGDIVCMRKIKPNWYDCY